jgi:hypothetical protein
MNVKCFFKYFLFSLIAISLVSCTTDGGRKSTFHADGLPYIVDFRLEGNPLPGNSFDVVLDYQQGPARGDTIVAGFFKINQPIPDGMVVQAGEISPVQYLEPNQTHQARLTLCVTRTGDFILFPHVSILQEDGSKPGMDYTSFVLTVNTDSFLFWDVDGDENPYRSTIDPAIDFSLPPEKQPTATVSIATPTPMTPTPTPVDFLLTNPNLCVQ